MARATPASRPADPTTAVPVYAEPPEAVWERSGSRPSGLTVAEVASRRRTPTARTEGGSRAGAVLEELAESLAEPLMLLLIAVAVLSAIFGELRDAIAIFTVIVIIGAVEAIAEVRAKRALRALRDLSAQMRSSGGRAPPRQSRSAHSWSATSCSSRLAASLPRTRASSRPTASPPTSRG